MQLGRALHLPEVRDEELAGFLKRGGQGFELQCLGLLHLQHSASTDVGSECTRVSNFKVVWVLHGDLPRLASVKLRHTFNFGEGDKVAIF